MSIALPIGAAHLSAAGRYFDGGLEVRGSWEVEICAIDYIVLFISWPRNELHILKTINYIYLYIIIQFLAKNLNLCLK